MLIVTVQIERKVAAFTDFSEREFALAADLAHDRGNLGIGAEKDFVIRISEQHFIFLVKPVNFLLYILLRRLVDDILHYIFFFGERKIKLQIRKFEMFGD